MNEYAEQYPPVTPEHTVQPAAEVRAAANGTFSASAAPDYSSRSIPQPCAEEKEHRIRNFQFFGMGSFLYALFYTFCLYHNASGITYPFFVGGTLFFFFSSLKKSGISAKKDSVFYIVSLMLLGISTACTDADSIIIMNKTGIFVLSFVLMLHNFYSDDSWNLSTYILRICRLILGSVNIIGRPFSDLYLYLNKRKETGSAKNSKVKYILLGLVISIPLVFFVILLLSSADVVFSSVMSSVFDIDIPANLFGICFTVLFAFFASYCIITYLGARNMKENVPDKRTGEPMLAITVTSVLSIIYLIFSGIQIVYLFFGNMELPYHYTYAEYAREGFFQLLFVCLMNLALVLICLGRFKENKILKTILTVISLCTYIMIASSAMRMIMYIRCYALTFLRIFVLWSLAVIFLLMTGVVISIYKERFPLFKYSMVLVTVLYLGLSFSHPDYWIAKYNIACIPNLNEWESYGDGYYLSRLSADAAPILLSEETLNAFNYPSARNAGRDESGDLLYVNNSSWLPRYIYSLDSHIQYVQSRGTKARTFNLSRFIAGNYLPPSSSHSGH